MQLDLPLRRLINAGSEANHGTASTKATYITVDEDHDAVEIRESELRRGSAPCQAILNAGLPPSFSWRLRHGRVTPSGPTTLLTFVSV